MKPPLIWMEYGTTAERMHIENLDATIQGHATALAELKDQRKEAIRKIHKRSSAERRQHARRGAA